MQLAKNVIDIGLSINTRAEPRFWQQDAGVRFDHVQPIRSGQKQYRHDAHGLRLPNHHVELLPDAAPSGYRELIGAMASRRQSAWSILMATAFAWCRGHDGVTGIAVAAAVRDLATHCSSHGDILGFAG